VKSLYIFFVSFCTRHHLTYPRSDANTIAPYERIFSDHYDILEPQTIDGECDLPLTQGQNYFALLTHRTSRHNSYSKIRRIGPGTGLHPA